jgi:hypothetical protein
MQQPRPQATRRAKVRLQGYLLVSPVLISVCLPTQPL